MPKLAIGLGEATRLCRMSFEKRIAFLAEGLPIILRSAQSFRRAALLLKENPREAEVLNGFADEEAAKILILLDSVRCPKKSVSGRLGYIVASFYDHLSRLLYAEAARWRPTNLKELQSYLDDSRKAHYVEGSFGEYIVPNWLVSQRESRLYADVEAHEDDEVNWNDPTSVHADLFDLESAALQLVDAMSKMGMFTVAGLKLMSDVWDKVHFCDDQDWRDSEKLIEEYLEQLITLNLPHETATQEHMRAIYQYWQIPMYNLDLRMLDITMDELKKKQEAILLSEVGGHY